MKKHETRKAINNLIDYIALRFTSISRPGGRYMNRQEKRMTSRLLFYLRKQMAWLAARVPELEPFASTEDEEEKVRIIKTKTLESDMDALLERMPYNDKIVESMTFYSGASMVKGGNFRINKMKIGKVVGTFNLQTPEVTRYIQRMEDLQLSNFKGSIQRTTKKAIKKLVVQGGLAGDSASTISKLIQEQGVAGVFSQARGELIATREIGKAFGKGQNTVVSKYVAKTGAEVVKDWLTAGDDKVRDSHAQNEEDGEIQLNDAFSGTGEDFAPSADFGCRCVSNYRTV